MRVLIIDDHALFRIGLSELLERRGIDVVDAIGDCEVGVMLASDAHPDVVLLDVHLPGGDGPAVIKGVRAHDVDTTFLVAFCHAHKLLQHMQNEWTMIAGKHDEHRFAAEISPADLVTVNIRHREIGCGSAQIEHGRGCSGH